MLFLPHRLEDVQSVTRCNTNRSITATIFSDTRSFLLKYPAIQLWEEGEKQRKKRMIGVGLKERETETETERDRGFTNFTQTHDRCNFSLFDNFNLHISP